MFGSNLCLVVFVVIAIEFDESGDKKNKKMLAFQVKSIDFNCSYEERRYSCGIEQSFGMFIAQRSEKNALK